jgi:hypothetical protein
MPMSARLGGILSGQTGWKGDVAGTHVEITGESGPAMCVRTVRILAGRTETRSLSFFRRLDDRHGSWKSLPMRLVRMFWVRFRHVH